MTNLLWTIFFVILASLLVSCGIKDNLIKGIKYYQQNSETPIDGVSETNETAPKETIKDIGKPMKKPTFIGAEASSQEPVKVLPEISKVSNDVWHELYIDFMSTYSIVETEYGDFILYDDKINGIEYIMLYDLDHDGVPELFIEGGYESTCIYSIKDNKVIFLDEIIPGDADIVKNLNTNKDTMFVSTLLEGDGGIYYLSNLDMESGKIVYEILFGEYSSSNDSLNEFYLNVKDRNETLEEAMRDNENRQVSEEEYEEAIEEFEKAHEKVREITSYYTPFYDEESFDEGMGMFMDALDDYVMNNE